MALDKSDPHRTPSGRFAWACFFMLLVSVTVGCGDSYEAVKAIEGVYQPTVTAPNGSHCVQIEGRRDGWLWFNPTTQPIICQPIRVSELGVMTYGWEVRQPGLKLEVGRVEFSDASVFIATANLRETGRFEYTDRSPSLGDWTRNNPFKTVLLVLIGTVVAVTIPLRAAARDSEKRRERDRLEAEAATKAAARAAALARLAQLAADARGAADSLPIILGEAELTLDRAQEELKSQLPSPFWEAMEEAVAKLRAFHHALSIIEAKRTEHRTQSTQLGGRVPPFTLGVSVLPHPAATQARLTRLYRGAQSIPHFSIVYEQRRTTATLIEGFRSLGQAIEGLGDRIVNEISSLAASMDCRLASLESSLESSAAAAAEQSAALRTQLQSAAGVNEAVRGQIRQDAEARSETERLALRMLDNIQRGRKPTIFDRP